MTFLLFCLYSVYQIASMIDENFTWKIDIISKSNAGVPRSPSLDAQLFAHQQAS